MKEGSGGKERRKERGMEGMEDRSGREEGREEKRETRCKIVTQELISQETIMILDFFNLSWNSHTFS